nr:beta-2-microglobulin-2 [Ogcocephalus cubifrons]
MKGVICLLLVGLFFLSVPSAAGESSPKVQVYSRLPGELGKPNTLICHVCSFHPPEIDIDLLRNGEEMQGGNQTDLAFEEDWHYHLTKHMSFTPRGEEFACRVTHMGKTRTYIWEPDV